MRYPAACKMEWHYRYPVCDTPEETLGMIVFLIVVILVIGCIGAWIDSRGKK